MGNDEQIHIQELLNVLRKRLRVLELQAAQQGANTLPHIILEIDDIKEQMSKREIQLAELNVLRSSTAQPNTPYSTLDEHVQSPVQPNDLYSEFDKRLHIRTSNRSIRIILAFLVFFGGAITAAFFLIKRADDLKVRATQTAIANNNMVTQTSAPTFEPSPSFSFPTPIINFPTSVSDLPKVVSQQTTLSTENWIYRYSDEKCTPSACTFERDSIGTLQSQHRFIVLLVFVGNQTTIARPLPDGFFVLRDSQGRTYSSLPDASEIYVVRGLNADYNETDSILPLSSGFSYTVALVFDVPSDAQELILTSVEVPDQGWLVLE